MEPHKIEIFGDLGVSKKKSSSGRIKSWIIVILAAALILTWLGPYIEDFDITGAFTTDSLESSYYSLGVEDAPVEMVVFSDFQCSFCSRFSLETLPQIKAEYIDTGKVKFVFKHLPLGFHDMAERAAWASICAGKQGKFWEYHDGIFEEQSQLSVDFLKSLAEDLELDTEKFTACLLDETVLGEINLDKQAASASGISGTPSFLINGELLVGAQPFESFKAVIDRKLTE